MLKTLKEYISYMGGFRLGYVDNIQPMASLGDKPPKGQGGKDSRGVGLNANYSSQAPGTMRPTVSLTAQTNTLLNKIKDKYKLTKDQLADLTKLPMATLTSILNSAGALAQYLPMGEQTELEKYFDNIEKEKTK